MYFLYFHFYFFAEAWMKGKSAQWNSWTHIIPAQFICKLIPILAISNVKTTSTARDKHIIGLSLPHPSFLSPLSYVFLFAFFFHRRSFLSRWCEFLADSYNNNELYLHDHNYTNTCTNTYSVAKSYLGIKITTQGNYVTLIIICHEHRKKLEYMSFPVANEPSFALCF